MNLLGWILASAFFSGLLGYAIAMLVGVIYPAWVDENAPIFCGICAALGCLVQWLPYLNKHD